MGDYRRFLTALGQRESGNRHHCVNSLGFTGKYQFGEALLIDLGYYQAYRYYNGGDNGVDKNYWEGTWTEKARRFGVHDYYDFRCNVGNIQDAIIKDEFRFNTKNIKEYIEDAGKDFDRCLRNSEYTYSGILAAAHLQGAWGAAQFLMHGSRRSDEYGTCITEYAETFSGYNFDQFK